MRFWVIVEVDEKTGADISYVWYCTETKVVHTKELDRARKFFTRAGAREYFALHRTLLEDTHKVVSINESGAY
ncbi:MAG: hypothetical protein AMXMBFR16_10870 [Candidatus Uhrbacteria bacterium]